MKILSLSVVVPTRSCVNDCGPCVSKMHATARDYPCMSPNLSDGRTEAEYRKRLEFARDNGCNTALLTGSGEPQQNWDFIGWITNLNERLDKPFRWMEIQTTGVMMDEKHVGYLEDRGIDTVALSLFSFDDDENMNCRGSKLPVSIEKFCGWVKGAGMNLRLSLNMNHRFAVKPELLFTACRNLGADQVTLRRLYVSDEGSPQAEWIRKNDCDLLNVNAYVASHPIIRRLETGPVIHDVMGMGVISDQDCMARDLRDENDLRYLILRPNGKLYSSWDTKASLVF